MIGAPLTASRSSRDLEEILGERGVIVDHATLSRLVVKFSPLVATEVHKRKKPGAVSWRMDEAYIKVRGNGRICTARLIVMAKP